MWKKSRSGNNQQIEIITVRTQNWYMIQNLIPTRVRRTLLNDFNPYSNTYRRMDESYSNRETYSQNTKREPNFDLPSNKRAKFCTILKCTYSMAATDHLQVTTTYRIFHVWQQKRLKIKSTLGKIPIRRDTSLDEVNEASYHLIQTYNTSTTSLKHINWNKESKLDKLLTHC